MTAPVFPPAPVPLASRAAPATFPQDNDAALVWEKAFRDVLAGSVPFYEGLVTDSEQAVTDATAQVALAVTQVGLATAQVALAADEVDLAAGQVTLAEAQVALADAQRVLAQAAAAAAVITANAPLWVSEASYTAGANAISPIEFGTYRAITTHTGETTDPSADATNWVKISAVPSLSTEATTGATQSIDFSSNKIVTSTANAATVTYTFASPAAVAKVDLVIDYQALAGFDLSNASYDSVSFSVNGQDTSPREIAFNADGTKMFIIGALSDRVFQYTLSTGFNVSTASYDSVSFSVNGQEASPTSIAFNADGTKMFIIGTTSDSVFQYTLSTGFNVSTASYDSVSFSVSGQEADPNSIAFNADGTKMFIIGEFSDSVFQYTLSTGFNVSTASYDSVSFSVSGQDTTPNSIAFNADGTKMFIIGTTSDSVFQYTLSTGFNVSTASYDSVSFSVNGQDNTPTSIAFNADGTKMFITGTSSDSVFQYATATGATLVFPTMQGPAIPLVTLQKTAVTIVTADGGTSYQVISTLGGIV